MVFTGFPLVALTVISTVIITVSPFTTYLGHSAELEQSAVPKTYVRSMNIYRPFTVYRII